MTSSEHAAAESSMALNAALPLSTPRQPALCRYYHRSGTCRYASACRLRHVRAASAPETAGAPVEGLLPHVSERQWCLSSEDEECDALAQQQGWRFSVASYNVLADVYAKQYRSYLYGDVPACYLDWAHRRSAIVAELAHLQPDIVCLQEVDRFEELEEALQPLGYSGIYLQRDGSRWDGCATFWRTSLLRPVLVRQLRYSEYDLKDNVALLVLFEPLRSRGGSGGAGAGDDADRGGGGVLLQAPTQAPMDSPLLRSQEEQERQQAARHRQDLLSQWLPRSWLPHHHGPRAPQRSASQRHAGLGSSPYQLPAEVTARSRSWAGDGARSPRRAAWPGRSRRSGAAGDGLGAAAAAAAAAAQQEQAEEQEEEEEETRRLAPEWQRCAVLVANTHVIFTPEKGEVKLGQARMLVQEAASMAEWYLDQQQQQQQQQLGPDAGAGAGSLLPPAVATIIAGDFNATPRSPMYSFLSRGAVDLRRINRRNVSHMSSGGAPSGAVAKGYRGFRRAHKRRSVEEQRRGSLDEPQQQQQQQQLAAAAANGAGAGSHAQQEWAAGGVLGGGAVALHTAAAAPPTSPAASSAAEPEGGNGGGRGGSSSKLYQWSDKEVRRAAGMSYDELLEASTAAVAGEDAAAAPGERPASPGTQIARAAAAFGERAAAGAGAAAASLAAAAAADAGGEGADEAAAAAVAAAAATPAGDEPTRPLLLRHGLQLQSSYASVLGREPDYTSMHNMFADTCDYIWFSQSPITVPALRGEGGGGKGGGRGGGEGGGGAACQLEYELRPLAVLVPPDGMRLPRGLPSRWMGSDHVCLVADFEVTLKAAGGSGGSGGSAASGRE